jgi:hypothetical protein
LTGGVPACIIALSLGGCNRSRDSAVFWYPPLQDLRIPVIYWALLVAVLCGTLLYFFIRRPTDKKLIEFILPALLTGTLAATLFLTQVIGTREEAPRAPMEDPKQPIESYVAPAERPRVASGRTWSLCEGVDSLHTPPHAQSANVPSVSLEIAGEGFTGTEREMLRGQLIRRVQASTDAREVWLRVVATPLEAEGASMSQVAVALRWTQRTAGSPEVTLADDIVARGSTVAQARRLALSCAARAVAARAANRIAGV